MSGEGWSDRHATEVWAAAAFVPPAMAGLLSMGRPILQDSHTVLVLVVVVALISASGLPAAGVGAAVTAALGFDYSWTEPCGSLTIDDAAHLITVVLLLVVAVVTGSLTRWVAQQQAVAARQRNYLDAVHTAVAASSAADSPADGVAAVCQALTAVLGADRCQLVRGPAAGSPQLYAEGTVMQGGQVLDVERWGLPTDDVMVVPIGGSGDGPVHFAITAATQIVRPSLEQRQVAALIARLANTGLPTLH